MASRFVYLVEIRQKFQFEKEVSGAKLRRIIAFPAVAISFGKNNQIFPVRIRQITVFIRVPFGRIGRIEQILISPPAAVFLSHKVERERQSDLG